MARAGAFVARYTDELPRLVATETLVAGADARRRPATDSSAELRPRGDRSRSLRGSHFPARSEAIGFRDVIEVDGQPAGPSARDWWICCTAPARPAGRRRARFFRKGARHNLVAGVPQLQPADRRAVLPAARARSRDSVGSGGPRPSAPVWELEFRERDRPTLIRQGDGQPVFSRGRVWIEAATGAILRTELVLEFDDVVYTLTTRFERVAAMDLILPVALDERYASPEEIVTGTRDLHELPPLPDRRSAGSVTAGLKCHGRPAGLQSTGPPNQRLERRHHSQHDAERADDGRAGRQVELQ